MNPCDSKRNLHCPVLFIYIATHVQYYLIPDSCTKLRRFDRTNKRRNMRRQYRYNPLVIFCEGNNIIIVPTHITLPIFFRMFSFIDHLNGPEGVTVMGQDRDHQGTNRLVSGGLVDGPMKEIGLVGVWNVADFSALHAPPHASLFGRDLDDTVRACGHLRPQLLGFFIDQEQCCSLGSDQVVSIVHDRFENALEFPGALRAIRLLRVHEKQYSHPQQTTRHNPHARTEGAAHAGYPGIQLLGG
mmetsp:Transcript_26771/g.73650  ORF Transcript_26771/g.73650 Transcript_26771/m.73650 type:complete len:243 (-) Transcript_26771:982-1710(-)